MQKAIKELTDECDNYKKAGNTAQVELIESQKTLIEKFLPQMMSEDEIYEVINGLEDKTVPAVMKHFKANYAG